MAWYISSTSSRGCAAARSAMPNTPRWSQACPICQPGSEWNYSRSTDILGRLIEVVSGKTLGAFLNQRIFAPLQMSETGFHAESENAHRLAEPFPTDPWGGEPVQLFNMLEKPAMGIRRGRSRLHCDGLFAVLPDAPQWRRAGWCQDHRPQDAGTDDVQDHLGESVKIQGALIQPGHRFGLGFGVRTQGGIAPFMGSVGQFFWSGIGGTFFWIDPREDLFAIFMSQAPGQRVYTRTLVRQPGLCGGGLT